MTTELNDYHVEAICRKRGPSATLGKVRITLPAVRSNETLERTKAAVVEHLSRGWHVLKITVTEKGMDH